MKMATVYGDDNVTTLYKRDALGRIVFWRIETDGSYERVSYGLFERLSDVGQVIVSASTKTSYKSQIKRKIDRGYKTAEMYGVTSDQGGSVGCAAGSGTGEDETARLLNELVVKELLDGLSAEEQTLIRLRYFEDKTQTVVAQALGVNQVKVSRMEKKILLSMRKKLTQ